MYWCPVIIYFRSVYSVNYCKKINSNQSNSSWTAFQNHKAHAEAYLYGHNCKWPTVVLMHCTLHVIFKYILFSADTFISCHKDMTIILIKRYTVIKTLPVMRACKNSYYNRYCMTLVSLMIKTLNSQIQHLSSLCVMMPQLQGTGWLFWCFPFFLHLTHHY